MIQGNIAIPSPHSLKRPRPRRKPRSYPADMPTIVIPKRKPNSILAHLLEDITPEEHRRRAELAGELFRTIVRRAQQTAVEKPARLARSYPVAAASEASGGLGVWATFAPGFAVTVSATAARMP